MIMGALANRIAGHSDDVICVVGMHRSGTSLIAQILKHSGLYLGPEHALLGSNIGNQDGHFEHTGFIELNDILLKHLGGSWDFPPDLPSAWESAASLEPLRSRARELLQSFSGKSPWGWKDPRTSLLLPFWRSLIPNLRVVICVRSPLAVANSLQARDNIVPTRGAYLWDRYMKASLADTEGCPRLVVFYDRYFNNPATDVAKLLDFCGLPPCANTAAAATIRGELRHQPSDITALLACDQIASETKLLYLGLRGLDLSGDDLASAKSEADETINQLLRVLDSQAQQQAVNSLQARLNRSESNLANLRAEIWRDAKANHRWAYRFYRKILRPFQLARLRSSQ